MKYIGMTCQSRIAHFLIPIKDQYNTIYTSIREAADILGIPAYNISKVVRGEVKKPKHGYYFTKVEV